MKKVILFLTLLFLLAGGVLAADFPQPQGYVNDFAGLFSPTFVEQLEADLSNFEEQTRAEVAVVTIEALNDYSVEEYAVRLFEEWQIGKKEKDNGLLLLIAKNERKIRIEVGYGLEPVVTDARAGRIIREKITPNFKQEEYEQGVSQAVEAIKEYIEQGEPPQGTEAAREKLSNFFFVLVLSSFILMYLAAFWGRTKEFTTGGIQGACLGGFLGWVLGSLVTVLALAVFLGLLGLILDFIFSRNYKRLKSEGKPTGFWGSRGGFFSGSKGSSGGFGGFGGGSSGGGGASGGW